MAALLDHCAKASWREGEAGSNVELWKCPLRPVKVK